MVEEVWICPDGVAGALNCLFFGDRAGVGSLNPESGNCECRRSIAAIPRA